jgi:hypothetical protein
MAYTKEQILAVLAKVHKPELAKQPGMVWQVWQDGEITLQKSGELLWRRNLHMMTPGLKIRCVPADWMPSYQEGDVNTYAFVSSEEDAMIVRNMINNLDGHTPELDIYFEAHQSVKAGR